MQGLCAARRYEKGEVITVHVGEILGHEAEGGEEFERRVAAGGGRHVMAVAGGVCWWMALRGIRGHNILMPHITCLARGVTMRDLREPAR